MTIAQELASFVVRVTYDDMSPTARHEMKIRILDSIGCAIGAVEGEPIRHIRSQIEDFGGGDHSTLIGGGKTSPDRGRLLQLGADAVPRLQRLLPGQGRELPPERQPRRRARGAGVRGRRTGPT